MASGCITEQGECLLNLAGSTKQPAAYEEAIHRDEKRGDDRNAAVGRFWLGSVRLEQGHHQEALDAYEDAARAFTSLNEPSTVAQSWHQTGMAYQNAAAGKRRRMPTRKSLAIMVRLKECRRAGEHARANWGNYV